MEGENNSPRLISCMSSDSRSASKGLTASYWRLSSLQVFGVQMQFLSIAAADRSALIATTTCAHVLDTHRANAQFRQT